MESICRYSAKDCNVFLAAQAVFSGQNRVAQLTQLILLTDPDQIATAKCLINALIVHMKSPPVPLSGNPTYQASLTTSALSNTF